MSGEFLELIFREDPTLRRRVTESITRTIQRSFVEDGSQITGDETRRRFRIVEGLIRELRSEHQWPFPRILDALPTALRCRLDRVEWDPTKQRLIWTPPTVV